MAGCLPVNEYRRALLSIVALSEREFMIDEHKQFPVEVPDDDLFQGIVFEGASAGKFTIGEKDILSHRSGDHIPGMRPCCCSLTFIISSCCYRPLVGLFNSF